MAMGVLLSWSPVMKRHISNTAPRFAASFGPIESVILIKTREDLIHVLTEAAEIEHNLLCSYLYAAFSLKRAGEAGLTSEQGRSVERWRELVMSVAVEEMAHLACVNNLLVAIGGAAHFDRPNLPVSPGYLPSGIVVRLTPFTPETLDHFIFLERPISNDLADGTGFRPGSIERTDVRESLTPRSINYETIGDLYDAVSAGLELVESSLGETVLFAHGRRGQLDARQTGLASVSPVDSLSSALRLVEQIKEQGEGSSGARGDCHFDRFQEIKKDWHRLLADDEEFKPAWPAAADPVMRKPLTRDRRVWICAEPVAAYLDFGNAIYGLILTILQQVFSIDNRSTQTALMKLAASLMEPLQIIGDALARMPAGPQHSDLNAGLTFSVPRNLGARTADMGPQLLERLDLFDNAARGFGDKGSQERLQSALTRCRTLVPRSP